MIPRTYEIDGEATTPEGEVVKIAATVLVSGDWVHGTLETPPESPDVTIEEVFTLVNENWIPIWWELLASDREEIENEALTIDGERDDCGVAD